MISPNLPARPGILKKMLFALIALTGLISVSCSKTQSYSELLRDEEKAVNWFLAQNRVAIDIPADSISFETGGDAPFYKLDEDGTVYMQVINKGQLGADGKPAEKIEAGDQVYFRYLRKNIKAMYEGYGDMESGNSDNLAKPSYFFYKNTTIPASTAWGTGIQIPMRFFSYDCEVNLVVKSRNGFMSDQLNCYPYYINVRYFKPEY